MMISRTYRVSLIFKSSSAASNKDWNEAKSVSITTCQKVYSDPKQSRYIFKKCPKNGININVNYLDTNSQDIKQQRPTILAVHGAPGNYNDFDAVISRFREKGFRVVAPNFPDETGTFRHTTEEKAEFLSDFLKKIDVKRIDVAIMHSSAVYPCLKVWKDEPNLIQSIVMINPAGHRTIKAMRPEWFISNLARFNLHPLGRKIFNTLGKPLVAAAGVAVSVENLNNAVLACLTMYLAKTSRLKEYLEVLRQKKTPTAYFYAEKDKLVDKQIFHEMTRLLGADIENVTVYNKEGKVVQDAKPNSQIDNWLKITSFKEGGHYAFKSYPEIIDEEVLRLVAKVWSSQAGSNGSLEQSAQNNEEQNSSSVDETVVKTDERKMYAVNASRSNLF